MYLIHLLPHPPHPITPHLPPTRPLISAHLKKSAQKAKNQALTKFKGFLYELLGIVDYIGGEEMTAN